MKPEICLVDNGMSITELPRAVREGRITRTEALDLHDNWVIDKALFHGYNRPRLRLDTIIRKIRAEIEKIVKVEIKEIM